jgi:DNA-binding transcriptional LysR family regulator
MTLEQLRMLVSVAQTGTLKSASEQLHKTQPAVSQGIAKLEASLGVILFSREQYRLSLTKEGLRLFQHAQSILSETEKMLTLAQHYEAGFETEITLAFEASFDLSHLLPTLEKTQAAFPETQIILKQHYVSGAVQSVEQEAADIAFSPVFDRVRISNRFDLRPIYEGCLVTVAAPKLMNRHPDYSALVDLQSEYQIVVQDTGTETKGVDLGVQEGQRRWYANDFSTKKRLILSGMGWGSLPDFLIEKEIGTGELVEITGERIPTRARPIKYFAVRRANRIQGPVGNYLWQHLPSINES